MPLVIVTGRPCTGKSTVAAALAERLRRADPSKSVIVLNDESLGIAKAAAYATPAAEKMARAALKAAVERAVTKDTTVIADGLNYIKGYRYELYCVVRSAGSTHVCLFVDGPVEAARLANEERAKAAGAAASYPDAVFSELWSRFETPEERNRWEAPLFRLDEEHVAEARAEATAAAPAVAAVASSVPAGAASAAPAAAPAAVAATKPSAFKRAGAGAAPPPPPAAVGGGATAAAGAPVKSSFRRAAPAPPAPAAATAAASVAAAAAVRVPAASGAAEAAGDARDDDNDDSDGASSTFTPPDDSDSEGGEGGGEGGGEDGGAAAAAGGGRPHPATPAAAAAAGGGTVALSAATAAAAAAPVGLDGMLGAVVDALLRRPGLRPHMSTLATKTAAPTYLQDLDRRTNEVVLLLTAAAATAVIGDAIPVPGCPVAVRLRRKPSPVELKRLQRTFVRVAAAAPIDDPALITRRFVEEINAWLEA